MSFAPSSPFNGGAQTGFTSPTYTPSADTAPAINAKQYAVTSVGGTQAGVDVHSVSRPFTITMFKPLVNKPLGRLNPVTGQLTSVPRNVYTVNVRKGVTPLAGQESVNMLASIRLEIPAGADIADPANVKACLSAIIGVLSNTSAGIGDTALSGIL